MATVWLEKETCRTGDFPDVCMRCGGPAGERLNRKFWWIPGWAYLTLLIHPGQFAETFFEEPSFRFLLRERQGAFVGNTGLSVPTQSPAQIRPCRMGELVIR